MKCSPWDFFSRRFGFGAGLWGGKGFLMFIKFMLLGNEKQLLHPAMSSLQTCAALKEPPASNCRCSSSKTHSALSFRSEMSLNAVLGIFTVFSRWEKMLHEQKSSAQKSQILNLLGLLIDQACQKTLCEEKSWHKGGEELDLFGRRMRAGPGGGGEVGGGAEGECGPCTCISVASWERKQDLEVKQHPATPHLFLSFSSPYPRNVYAGFPAPQCRQRKRWISRS